MREDGVVLKSGSGNADASTPSHTHVLGSHTSIAIP